jgi:hypothetical protein
MGVGVNHHLFAHPGQGSNTSWCHGHLVSHATNLDADDLSST